MSDGGLLAWKIQKIKQPANGVQSTCNFTDLNHPLPEPPKDQMWVKEGRDWKLVPVVEAVPASVELEMTTASVEKVIENPDEAVETVATVSTAVPVTSCTNNVTDVKEDGCIYHHVEETDTFQGICLRYRVTPVELRRANKMMGTNLKLAPEKLLIPMNKKNAALKDNTSREMTKEEQIAKLVCEVRKHILQLPDDKPQQEYIEYSEARAYLEMNDWDMDKAVENAVEALCWSSEHT